MHTKGKATSWIINNLSHHCAGPSHCGSYGVRPVMNLQSQLCGLKPEIPDFIRVNH